MTLGARRQGDSPFVDRGIGIQFRLKDVNAMAGRAGGRIRPSSGREHPMNALPELFRYVGVARTSCLGDVRTKDGGFRIHEGPEVMASMAACAGDLSRHPMDASLKFLTGHGRPQGMLFDKFNIGMATVAGFVDIGHVDRRLGVLAPQNTMLPVTIKAIGGDLSVLHDAFRVKPPMVLSFCLPVAAPAMHALFPRVFPSLRLLGVSNPGMAIGTGKLPVDGTLETRLRDKEGDLFPERILFFQ